MLYIRLSQDFDLRPVSCIPLKRVKDIERDFKNLQNRNILYKLEFVTSYELQEIYIFFAGHNIRNK